MKTANCLTSGGFVRVVAPKVPCPPRLDYIESPFMPGYRARRRAELRAEFWCRSALAGWTAAAVFAGSFVWAVLLSR